MSDKLKIKRIYALSPMQEGILFHTLLKENSEAYFEQTVLSVCGDIKVPLFNKALDTLINRYDVLRTNFVYQNIRRPKQVVFEKRSSEVFYKDISDFSDNVKQDYVTDYISKDRKKGFDLTKDVLIRVSILRTGLSEYMVIWSFHHILIDGWCIGIIINDFLKIYGGFIQSKNIELEDVFSYHRYIEWLESQDKQNALYYWERYLKDYELNAQVPGKKKTFDENVYTLKTHTFHIGYELTDGVESFSRDFGITVNTIFQSIWGILLQRYNNSKEVVFGVVVSGRPYQISGIDKAVGLFMNTIPRRVISDEKKTYIELLRDIQQDIAVGNDYCFVSLADIQAVSQLKRDLINNILIFENYPIENGTFKNEYFGFEITEINAFEQTNYNFNITIEPSANIKVKLSYNSEVYYESFIKRIEAHLIAVIKAILRNPTILISNINIIDKEERHKILIELNNTYTEHSKNKTISKLFEDQVKRTPEDIALISGEKSLTYKELNEKSNQLARILRRKGVKNESIIGVMTSRTFEMIIGIFAILKAGGAFLPIDPESPDERILYMLEDTQTRILLTSGVLFDKVEFNGEKIEVYHENLYMESGTNIRTLSSGENLAYVIYTSGSTGKPKGVMIEHKSVINFFEGMEDVIEFKPQKEIVCLTTFSFDIFLLETILPLTKGFKVVIANEREQNDPESLNNLMLKYNVEIMQVTPSRMQLILSDKKNIAFLKKLKEILIGGEALPESLLIELKKKTEARIFNMYGPTETTVWSTVKELTHSRRVNIGKPIRNTQIFILDRNNNLQPLGIIGELCIGGDGLARGYLNSEALTEEKFIKNPHLSGERIYKTGDLARRMSDGSIECFGRLDDQVKISGYRIELGEIESKLKQHNEVLDAVATVKQNNKDDKVICCYYVSKLDLNIFELREFLSKSLPYYMIPSYFVRLGEIPLNTNGKVDRKKLLEPKFDMDSRSRHVEPSNNIEKNLIQAWKDVLGINDIGIEDNFFYLGGNSIKAIQIVALLKNIRVNLRDIMQYPTISQLSAHCTNIIGDTLQIVQEKNIKVKSSSNSSDEKMQNCINYKVVNGIDPFNEIFFKDCFYNAIFPIIKHYKRSITPFLINEVMVYSLKIDGKIACLYQNYLALQDTKSLLSDMGIFTETKVFNENLIDSIINAIRKDRLVTFLVDCFYEPIRTDSYGKIHWPHAITVFGYCNDNKKLMIIEHNNKNSLTYTKKELSYSSANEAYTGYISYFQKGESIDTYFEFFSEEDRMIQTENNDFYRDLFTKNIISKSEQILNGFNDLLHFIEFMESKLQNDSFEIINIDDVLYNFNMILNAKNIEIYRISILLKNYEIIKLLNDMRNHWKFAILYLERYKMSDENWSNNFISLISRLRKIYDLEITYRKMIMNPIGI